MLKKVFKFLVLLFIGILLFKSIFLNGIKLNGIHGAVYLIIGYLALMLVGKKGFINRYNKKKNTRNDIFDFSIIEILNKYSEENIFDISCIILISISILLVITS